MQEEDFLGIEAELESAMSAEQMATGAPPQSEEPKAERIMPLQALKPSDYTQSQLDRLLTSVHEKHTYMQEVHNKLEAVDKAYHMYKQGTPSAGDLPAGCATAEGDLDRIVPPIVISQVDSLVSHLTSLFLRGYPLFPVVSTPANRQWAEQLETMIDDHATIDGYVRKLALFIRSSVKYNFCALEPSWATVNAYNVSRDPLQIEGMPSMEEDQSGLTSLKVLDPYNTILDHTVSPADIPTKGDYAGYTERLSYIRAKALTNELSEQKAGINIGKALKTNHTTGRVFLREHPLINEYITSAAHRSGPNYDSYFTIQPENSREARGVAFEHIVLYARLVPSDYGFTGLKRPNHPCIFKLEWLNGVLIHCAKVVTAYNILPILVGMPFEDGLGFQTKSLAESAIPLQKGAQTLYSIRFNAARRTVSDRAIYDSDAISPTDVNSPAPAAKIPLRSKSLLGSRSISDLYYQIPFDPRGTETVLQDAVVISNFSKDLFGLNSVAQGQFQPGNKSVDEFQRTMQGVDEKLALPGLILEHQVFVPLKNIIKLHIYLYGQDAHLISQKTGNEVTVDINELRKHVLAFRIADGMNPKDQMASTQDIELFANLIMNSPALQASYGAALPNIVDHLAQLRGIRGFAEYLPQQPQGGQELPPTEPPMEGEMPNE